MTSLSSTATRSSPVPVCLPTGSGLPFVLILTRRRHQGISVVLVPTSSPGFSVTEIHTVGGISTSATYYEDVRVPITNVVGELNQGWKLITNQLNHERVALAARGGIANELFAEVVEWAKTEPAGDGHVYDIGWVREKIGGSLRAAQCLPT